MPAINRISYDIFQKLVFLPKSNYWLQSTCVKLLEKTRKTHLVYICLGFLRETYRSLDACLRYMSVSKQQALRFVFPNHTSKVSGFISKDVLYKIGNINIGPMSDVYSKVFVQSLIQIFDF